MNNKEKYLILIVDDSDFNIQILSNILKDSYHLIIVKDGVSALETVRNYKPDLILLDIVLPGLSGFEILVSLKNYELTRDIPVIIITSLSDNENEEKGLILGAVDYITRPFSNTIVKLRVGTQIKIIEQMRVIKQNSMIDELTEIPNRRSFNKQMESEWKRAVREGTHLGLLMIDVDKFKFFNDTYGHIEGDKVLKRVAGVIMRSLNRPGDFAARWGGEEFTVLLPNTEVSGCLKIAEEIRSNVENVIFQYLDGINENVTASIGVNSIIPNAHECVTSFIANADAALHQAKETGRNNVRFY